MDDYQRQLWTGRFKLYDDAELIDWWRRAPEEPGPVDEIALAEIRARDLDI